jgi:hypothetical protein
LRLDVVLGDGPRVIELWTEEMTTLDKTIFGPVQEVELDFLLAGLH